MFMNWSSLEKKFDSTDMKKFIIEQAESVRLSVKNNLSNIRKIVKEVRDFDDLIITGAGDKYLIPDISRFLWDEFAEKPCTVVHSRTLADNPPNFLNSKSLVIFLSQSGKTKDTMDALDLAISRKANCIGISNIKDISPDSFVKLHRYKKGHLIDAYTTEFTERPLPSTQTFHSIHILLNLLLLYILKEDGKETGELIKIFKKIHNRVDSLTKSKKLMSWAKEKAQELRNKTLGFYVLGDGIRYGVARKTALIMLMEGCKQDATPLKTEEFDHSLIETLEDSNKDKYCLILMKPRSDFVKPGMMKQVKRIKKMWRDFSDELVIEINPYNFIRNPEKGLIANLVSPTFYTIQIEWLTYYLALARGIDPGVSELVKKVRDRR